MYRENNLDFLFLFLYTFLDEINHRVYINEVKQIFFVMAHVITKFMRIGGDVGKIFYNVELIMIIYMNKIANELIPGYLELTRCFCNILLDTSFYIPANFQRVDGFFDCLRNTITLSHEFITKGLLDKMCNLSEYIFPYEQTNPSLITSYSAMLSHFIGNSKSFNKNATTTDTNNNDNDNHGNYVNYFFDVLLKHMKQIGYDKTKSADHNEIVMSIEDVNNNNTEILQLCSDSDNIEVNNISQYKNYNTYLTIFHFIKILHVYDLIPLLNDTNQQLLLTSFLGFFSNSLLQARGTDIVQQIAKLILMIMVNYFIKPRSSKDNNITISKDTLCSNIVQSLTFSPIVVETIISTVVVAPKFEDKLNFQAKHSQILFDTSEISHKQILLLFQMIYTIMFQNISELGHQRGHNLLTDYIETYHVLKKCFDSV